jgi:predicted transcriptional regulator
VVITLYIVIYRMGSPLDDIQFLADSENRVTAIAELAAGSRTRAELRDATAASSATISRLLRAFENRGWVTGSRGRYHLTELGVYVADAFGEFHGRMTTANDLQSLLPALPLERLGLDIEAFTGAKVTVSTTSDPMAATVRLRELELGSLESRGLSSLFPEPCIDARHAAVVEGPQRLESVVSPTVVEAALSSKFGHKFVELVEADRCDIYVFTGTIELLGAINDGAACLALVHGERLALVETSNPTVVEAVSDAFEGYKSQATPLTTDVLRQTYASDFVTS